VIAGQLRGFEERIVRLTERFASRPRWRSEVVILGVCLSLVMAFPSYDLLFTDRFAAYWQAILTQVREPFVHHVYESASHFSKLDYRLTFPLIANVLRIGSLDVGPATAASLAVQLVAHQATVEI